MRSSADMQGLPSLRRRDAVQTSKGATKMAARTVPLDTFKWIVSGLLSVLVVGAGWFLGHIHAELRDISKEVSGIRIEAAVANTKLENLIEDFRCRPR
jgi:hypothetical protein